MTTLQAYFTVSANASLTIKNIILDARSVHDQDFEATLDVSPDQGSLTIENCKIMSSPAIHLPSGSFAIKKTPVPLGLSGEFTEPGATQSIYGHHSEYLST